MTQHHDKKILKTGTLPKTGGEYVMFLQTADDIPQILELQDKVFAALAPEEKAYLLYKDAAFFEKHFANGNPVIGISHNGQLIAQSIILHPTTKNPKTGMVDMNLPGGVDELSIIQGVIVDPAYRGNMLMTRMIDGWLQLAKSEGRDHIIAEVTVENHYSWAVFIKEGMKIHSLGLDPDDGITNVYNMHAFVPSLIQKRLSPDFNKAAAKDTTPCAWADLDAQKKLIEDGYKGVSFDLKNQQIGFKKSKYKPQ